MTTLITGFGPFPGVARNPTAWLAQELARTHERSLMAAVLPVSWDGAWAALEPLLEAARPRHVIMFGVSTGTHGFRLEQRAYNARGTHPDMDGAEPENATLLRTGPESLDAALPLAPIFSAVAAADLPVEHSSDPGRYLCNATLYRTLYWARGRSTRAGFVHVPPIGENAPLTPAQALTGAHLIVETALRAGDPAAATA